MWLALSERSQLVLNFGQAIQHGVQGLLRQLHSDILCASILPTVHLYNIHIWFDRAADCFEQSISRCSQAQHSSTLGKEHHLINNIRMNGANTYIYMCVHLIRKEACRDMRFINWLD